MAPQALLHASFAIERKLKIKWIDSAHLDAQTRSIVENTPVGFLVGTSVTGSDEDALEVLEYSIVSGNCHSADPSEGKGKETFLPTAALEPGVMDLTFAAKSAGRRTWLAAYLISYMATA